MVTHSNLELLSVGLPICGSETHMGALDQLMLVINMKEKNPTKKPKTYRKQQNPQPTKTNKQKTNKRNISSHAPVIKKNATLLEL